jgi:hypothetical protein
MAARHLKSCREYKASARRPLQRWHSSTSTMCKRFSRALPRVRPMSRSGLSGVLCRKCSGPRECLRARAQQTNDGAQSPTTTNIAATADSTRYVTRAKDSPQTVWVPRDSSAEASGAGRLRAYDRLRWKPHRFPCDCLAWRQFVYQPAAR